MLKDIENNNNNIDLNKIIYDSKDETETEMDFNFKNINIPSVKNQKKIQMIKNQYQIPKKILNQTPIVEYNDEQKRKKKKIKLKKIKSIKKTFFNNRDYSINDKNDILNYNLFSSSFFIPIENLDKYNINENMIKFENENDNEIVYIKENGNEIHDLRNGEKSNDIEIEIEKGNNTENEIENIKWNEIKENIYIPKNINFNRKNIVNIPNDLYKPIDYFNLIFSDFIMNKILESINQYFNQLTKKRKNKNKINTIDLDTLKCFIGIYLAMGIVRKNNIEDYWISTNIYSTPGISELFDKELFNDIFNIIGLFDNFFNISQFDDNSFLNIFNENCQKCYSPSQGLTIDKISIIQKYNNLQKKFKLFLLKESKNNYVLNCLIDVGKNKNNYYSHYHLINYLTKIYQNQGYILYIDKNFTSLELLSMLPSIGFYYVGLINENKINLSEKEKNIIMNNNDNIIYLKSNNGILLTIFKSNKNIYILSNCLTNNNIQKKIKYIKCDNNSINIQNEKQYTKIKTFPYSYIQYRKNKKENKFNHFLTYNTFIDKSKSLPAKYFFYFLEIAINNANILYNKFSLNKKISRLSFRKSIINDLILNYKIQKKSILEDIKKKNENELFNNVKIDYMPYIENDCRLEYSLKRKDCLLHKLKKLRKRTNWKCKVCQIFICGECYDIHRHNRYLILNKLLNKNSNS